MWQTIGPGFFGAGGGVGGMGGGGGPGGVTLADDVSVGVVVTAKVLTEIISMQATRTRTKAFFIGLSS